MSGPARRRFTVLVVEDDQAMRELLAESLIDDGFSVQTAGDGRTGIARVREGGIDLVISDVRMPDVDGLDLLREVRAGTPTPHVITITAFGSIETAKRAIKLGAYDYITKPFEIDKLLVVVRNALGERALQGEVETLKKAIGHTDRIGELLGKSGRMQEVFDLIGRFAPSPAPVLITGESGTGKELVAAAVHEHSPRAKKPFIKLHCAALAETLLESELFGHERGAFTGAVARRDGRFSQADGGTLFLDEIGDISPSIQVKLLRFLQEHEFERVGGNQTLHVDVRVVAATNRDLPARVREGAFREDLYYRLNVVTIEMPPLRVRSSDIPLLAMHFLQKYAAQNGKTIAGFSDAALECLGAYAWPGNVRELENAVERAIVITKTDVIRPEDFGPVIAGAKPGAASGVPQIPGSTLAELERYAILKTLEHAGGSTSRAAELLGISTRKIQYVLSELRGEKTGTPPE